MRKQLAEAEQRLAAAQRSASAYKGHAEKRAAELQRDLTQWSATAELRRQELETCAQADVQRLCEELERGLDARVEAGHVAPAAAAPEQADNDDDEADQDCQELFSLVMRSEIAQQRIDKKLDDGEEVGEAELRAADAELEQVQAALRSLRSKLGRKTRMLQSRDIALAKAAQDLIAARVKVRDWFIDVGLAACVATHPLANALMRCNASYCELTHAEYAVPQRAQHDSAVARTPARAHAHSQAPAARRARARSARAAARGGGRAAAAHQSHRIPRASRWLAVHSRNVALHVHARGSRRRVREHHPRRGDRHARLQRGHTKQVRLCNGLRRYVTFTVLTRT